MLGLGIKSFRGSSVAPAPTGDVLLLLHGENPIVDSSSYGNILDKVSYVYDPINGVAPDSYFLSTDRVVGSYSINLQTVNDVIYIYFSQIVQAVRFSRCTLEFYAKMPSYTGSGYLMAFFFCGIQLNWYKNYLSNQNNFNGVNVAAYIDSWSFYRIVANYDTQTVTVYVNGVLLGNIGISPRVVNNHLEGYSVLNPSVTRASGVFLDEIRITANQVLGAGMPTFPLTTTP